MSDYFACTRCGNRSEGYCLSCGACPEDRKSYCSYHLSQCVGLGHYILWGYPEPFTTTGNAASELVASVDNLKSTVGKVLSKFFKRLWHDFNGHPKNQVTWGSFLEGALCECGTRFYYWDFVM